MINSIYKIDNWAIPSAWVFPSLDYWAIGLSPGLMLGDVGGVAVFGVGRVVDDLELSVFVQISVPPSHLPRLALLLESELPVLAVTDS